MNGQPRKNDYFLESYNPSKLNQDGIDNMNRTITSTEIESVFYELPRNCPGPQGFAGQFYINFQKIKQAGTQLNSFYNTVIPKQGKTHKQIIENNVSHEHRFRNP